MSELGIFRFSLEGAESETLNLNYCCIFTEKNSIEIKIAFKREFVSRQGDEPLYEIKVKYENIALSALMKNFI